jgi:hypothetical protein
MTAVDISPLIQALVGAAATVIVVGTPTMIPFILSYFKIKTDSAAAQRVTTGVDALSDLAISYLHEANVSGITVSVPSAVAKAVTQASSGLQAAAKRAGTTPENLSSRVTASLLAKANASPSIAAQTTQGAPTS